MRTPNLRRSRGFAAALSAVLLSCAPDGGLDAQHREAQDHDVRGPESSGTTGRAEAALSQRLPATPTSTITGAMGTARAQAAAVLLPSGKVLVAGGVNRNGFVAGAERFDPDTGTWAPTADAGIVGNVTSGLMLASGKALFLWDGSRSGRVFDPVTETWTATGAMASARSLTSMTLLTSGKVLVAGGANLSSAELYDPETNAFAQTGVLSVAHRAHVAVALRDGRVLLVSGSSNTGGEVPVAELYDEATGSWSLAAAPLVPRHYASATLLPDGRVLLVGGYAAGGATTHAELYDPAANTWTATGPLAHPRNGHTATLLPSGKVLVAGGSNSARDTQGINELYDPSTGTWTPAGALHQPAENHLATLLPSGKVLVTGGFSSNPSLTFYARAELFDPAEHERVSTGVLPEPRASQAVLLSSGRVLLAGGAVASGAPVATSSLFDPAAASWSATSPMLAARVHATVTSLADGSVLAVGGEDTSALPLASTERFSPEDASWSTAGAMADARSRHTATRLPDSSVLVVGGRTATSAASPTTARFSPAAGTWSAAPALLQGRAAHAMVQLHNGRVLVSGGEAAGGTALNTVEALAPEAPAWTAVSPMSVARSHHTLTLLPDGRVLAIGGKSGTTRWSSAELYDPSSGTWAPAGALSAVREGHTAALLPSGKVLVAGGRTTGGAIAATFDVYDPALNAFTSISGAPASASMASVSLPGGEVLLLGPGIPGGSERYQDTGAHPAWRPVVFEVEGALAGCAAKLVGSNLLGISEGSGGSYQSSPANFPQVRVKDPEGGALWTLLAKDVSETAATVQLPATLRPGSYALTVFSNAIPGGRMLNVAENHAPISAPLALVARPGTATPLQLAGSDPNEGQALSWRIVTPPGHGTLSGAPPDLVYTSEEGYEGSDHFTYVVVDCGLQSEPATVSIEVVPPDTTPPVITCPADVLLAATDASGVEAVWPAVTATDARDPAPTVVTTPVLGDVLPIGVTEVVATATDAEGNTASCTFQVSVTAPALEVTGGGGQGCGCQPSGSGSTGLPLLAGLLAWTRLRRRSDRGAVG